MGKRTHKTFRGWLQHELTTQGIARREVARRLATKHPKGATPETIETYRRAIYRYLDESSPMIPNQSTRAAFAEALGVSLEEVPTEDEDEDLDIELAVTQMTRELRSLRRALKAVRA
jgi:hypothetical protein